MKKGFIFFLITVIMCSLNGCAIAGEIFKAGVWVGILFVVLIIALIIYLITRASNKK